MTIAVDLGRKTTGLGAKLIYMSYFGSLLHPREEKTWLLFSVRDMSWGHENPCFTKFSRVTYVTYVKFRYDTFQFYEIADNNLKKLHIRINHVPQP